MKINMMCFLSECKKINGARSASTTKVIYAAGNVLALGVLIALVTLIATSCDDRFDFLTSVNEAPRITIGRQGVSSTDPLLLSDAVKTSLKYNNLPYAIQLTASDRETQITSISYRFVTGTGSLQQLGKDLAGLIPVVAGAASIQFVPQDLGRVVIEFSIEDDFKKKSVAKADLEVFLNRPPVASFRFDFAGTHGPYEYRLDASASVDEDHGQGGQIQAYHFIINDSYHITTTQPVVIHSFEGPGPERRDVKLEVIDNDGAKSALFPLVVK